MSFNETPFVPNTPLWAPPFIPNRIFFGLSAIREDSKPKAFNTYGVAIDFNHFISQYIALATDFGYTVGSYAGIDYTKKMALIGAIVADVLNKIPKREPGLDIDVHVLVGLSSITSKVGPYKFTSNLFTADLGIGAGFPLNKKGSFRLGLNIDYMPTFSGGIKNNVRASGGKIWF